MECFKSPNSACIFIEKYVHYYKKCVHYYKKCVHYYKNYMHVDKKYIPIRTFGTNGTIYALIIHNANNTRNLGYLVISSP